VADFIDTQLPLNQRYAAQMEVLRSIKQLKTNVDDNIVFFFEYIKSSNALEAVAVTLAEFMQEHEDIAYKVAEIQRERAKVKAAWNEIQEKWNSDTGRNLVAYLQACGSVDAVRTIRAVVKLAVNLTVHEAILLLNCSIFDRCSNLSPFARSRRIHSSKIGIIPQDINKVVNLVPLQDKVEPISAKKIEDAGMEIGESGLLQLSSNDSAALTAAQNQLKRTRQKRDASMLEAPMQQAKHAKLALCTTSTFTRFDFGIEFMPIVPQSSRYRRSGVVPKLASPEDITLLKERGFAKISILPWWLNDQEMKDMILTEFAMYRHHRPAGSDNGLLHNMIFSIGQQLARQDPSLYVAHAVLRRKTRFLSYPQPATYIEPGSHINNLDYRASSAKFGINDEICITSDDCRDCLETIPGFHTYWNEWSQVAHDEHQRVELRNFRKSKGLKWACLACPAGTLLLLDTRLPLRLRFAATTSRCSFTVGFMSIEENDELENGASWNAIALSHLNLQAPACAPQESTPFPAAVEVFGLGYLSDALIGRRKWTSELVSEERDFVLGCSEEEFAAHYELWKKQAKAMALRCWKLVKEREMAHYGAESYWKVSRSE